LGHTIFSFSPCRPPPPPPPPDHSHTLLRRQYRVVFVHWRTNPWWPLVCTRRDRKLIIMDKGRGESRQWVDFNVGSARRICTSVWQYSRETNFVIVFIDIIVRKILSSAMLYEYFWMSIQALYRLCKCSPCNLCTAGWILNTHVVMLPIFTTINSTYFLSSASISELAQRFSDSSLHQNSCVAKPPSNVSVHWPDIFRNAEAVFGVTGRYRLSAGWRPVWGLAVQPIRNPRHTATLETTDCWLAALAGPPGDGRHIGLDTLTSTLWHGGRQWQPLWLLSSFIISRYGFSNTRRVNLIHFLV
jgi:hypothetical protein